MEAQNIGLGKCFFSMRVMSAQVAYVILLPLRGLQEWSALSHLQELEWPP
jgi:hypothetical protein